MSQAPPPRCAAATISLVVLDVALLVVHLELPALAHMDYTECVDRCAHFFNIIHEVDPVSYRMEPMLGGTPLINARIKCHAADSSVQACTTMALWALDCSRTTFH